MVWPIVLRSQETQKSNIKIVGLVKNRSAGLELLLIRAEKPTCRKLETFPSLPLQDLLGFESKDQTLAPAPVFAQAAPPVVGLAEAVPLLVLLLLLRHAPPPGILHDGGDAVDPLQRLHDCRQCQTSEKQSQFRSVLSEADL